MSQTVLAIDLGSTKIAAAIAQKKGNNISVNGVGIAKSQGLKKGVITNIDLAARSIKEAYIEANRVAGTNPKRATVSISGAYVKSTNSNGVVNIPNKEISLEEIDRVMQTALYNANIPHEYDVIHALPYRFKIDGQDFIEDPLGMNASRLEVDVHIITAPKSSISNLKKALKQAGIDIENIVLSGYASAITVLDEDEKELGSAVIDMGGSSCDLVIYQGNSIVNDDFLGVGSMHITNDLSMALHTPLFVAEEIKIVYGDLKEIKNDYIEIPVIGDENSPHQVSLEIVYNVIYARVEETLMILAKSIEKSGLKDQIGAGIILTGGMIKLNGIRELASAIFDNLPVRIAKPTNIESVTNKLEDPSFSTLVGLLRYGLGGFTPYEIDSNKVLKHHSIDYKKEEPPPILIKEEENKIEEEEMLNDLTNIESFEKKKVSLKEKIVQFTRWITHLF